MTTNQGTEPKDMQVHVISDDGVEVLFKSASAARSIDPAVGDQIQCLAERFAASCAQNGELPSPAIFVAMAKRTQHGIPARRVAQAKSHLRRRKAVDAAAAVFCGYLGFLLMIGANQRLTEQRYLAIIATDFVTISAPKSGHLVFVAEPGAVSKGDAVAGIRTADGDEFVVEAPCDCKLAAADARSGDQVSKNALLLKFWKQGPMEFLALRVKMADALRIKSGVLVTLQTIDSDNQRQFSVRSDAISISALPSISDGKPYGDVVVHIYPPQPLGLATGEVVSARLRSSLLESVSSVAQAGEGS
jgi:hypothetical protein